MRESTLLKKYKNDFLVCRESQNRRGRELSLHLVDGTVSDGLFLHVQKVESQGDPHPHRT
jgi:hypothetical protein